MANVADQRPVIDMDRTTPRKIQEQLRREVNFGCPVQGCGVPYLTWHHFDPPWREREHHNPEGMIALCANHASLADGGRWTKDQLKRLKKEPYVSSDKVSEYYDYLRKDVVCMVGNVAYNVKNVMEINDERVIGFEKDSEGYSRLNLFIRNKSGYPILVMENNSWTAFSEALFDLRCSLRGKELEIVSKDKETSLYIRFDDYPLEKFRNQLLECYRLSLSQLEKRFKTKELSLDVSSIDEFISYIGSPETVPTWTIRGRLFWGNVELSITPNGITDLKKDFFFGITFVMGGKTAFGFREDSVVLGVSGN